MSGGHYERLPMYALSTSSPRLRSSSSLSPSTLTRPPPNSHLPSRQHDHRHPYPSPPSKSRIPIRPRHIYALLKIFLPLTLVLLLLGLWFYEPHLELAFYDRNWVAKELVPVAPLSGCFNEGRVSGSYNVSERVYGVKRTEVHAGMPMRMGMDCYNFAGTIQPSPRLMPAEQSSLAELTAEERTQYHTYWRNDLAPFGPRQEYMLKSFFATQDPSITHLTLWSNGPLAENNPILQSYLARFPKAFDVKTVNIREMARGTELEGSGLLESKDTKAWVDGDLIRLLLLWNFGGVWVDMDSLLTRSLEPLLEHEFVTQWDCYDKLYVPLNGALMHFYKHSPYLCEAFHVISTSPPPRSGSTDWGATLYHKLFRRLLHAGVPPFKVLPFCFSDGRSCRLDNRLPDPFKPDGPMKDTVNLFATQTPTSNGTAATESKQEVKTGVKKGRGPLWTQGMGTEVGGGLDSVLGKVFAVHLHNQWEKPYPAGGWVERLLLKRYEEKLEF